MKFIDEYRDPVRARGLIAAIGRVAGRIGRPVTMMEICGSHTHAIGRFGIRKVLPESIRLISGPGCPVCVTSAKDVDTALYLAGCENTIFATFGDMLRVPGAGGESLQKKRARGADIRIIASALDALAMAQAAPDRDVILMGIGFETTAPTIAAALETGRLKGVRNVSLFSTHKTVPPALMALIADSRLNIDGFLCPGHVSSMIGSEAYRMIPEAGKAAVITGFEPVDILQGILMILQQIENGQMDVEIQYSRGVKPQGNIRAMEMLNRVFMPVDAVWRGIGLIPGSGLALRGEYAQYDVFNRFSIPEIESEDIPGCGCGDILRGVKTPEQCPLFRKVCSPVNPIGPCMVSSEGTCAAWFKFNEPAA